MRSFSRRSMRRSMRSSRKVAKVDLRKHFRAPTDEEYFAAKAIREEASRARTERWRAKERAEAKVRQAQWDLHWTTHRLGRRGRKLYFAIRAAHPDLPARAALYSARHGWDKDTLPRHYRVAWEWLTLAKLLLYGVGALVLLLAALALVGLGIYLLQ